MIDANLNRASEALRVLEDAARFALDALPAIPPRFSISGHLIRDTAQALADAARPGR